MLFGEAGKAFLQEAAVESGVVSDDEDYAVQETAHSAVVDLVYTRSAGVWSQRGPKLVGTGAVGNAYQGSSVALSADAITASVGGYGDDGFAGAAWAYTQPAFAGTPGKANCYGKSVSALARQYGASTQRPQPLATPACRHCKMPSWSFARANTNV